MKTIADYLETMFLNLPETPEIMQIKVDLLANMEDKYTELRDSGKSENEAIGTVIAEFGNIDELLAEMNLEEKEERVEEELAVVSLDEALSYVTAKKKIGLGIGSGIFFCAVAAALLILLTSEVFQISWLGLGFIPLFISLGIGVSLFIINGFKNESFSDLQKDFVLTGASRKEIQIQKKSFERTHLVSIVCGVTMCIFSLFPLLVTVYAWPDNEAYTFVSVALLLIVASIGVIFFTYTGNTMIAFETLLRHGKSRQPTKKDLREDKINHIFDKVYWPVMLILFFVLGFTNIGGGFARSWLIFPIAGIFQEAIKALLGVSSDGDKY